MEKQNFITYFNLIVMLFFALDAFAMSSANYIIKAQVLSGGGGFQSSANYMKLSTIGESISTVESLSTGYLNYGGFWNAVTAIPIPDRIGIYVDSTWYLDRNGNGYWDGEPTDKYGYFGLPGAIPVTGKW